MKLSRALRTWSSGLRGNSGKNSDASSQQTDAAEESEYDVTDAGGGAAKVAPSLTERVISPMSREEQRRLEMESQNTMHEIIESRLFLGPLPNTDALDVCAFSARQSSFLPSPSSYAFTANTLALRTHNSCLSIAHVFMRAYSLPDGSGFLHAAKHGTETRRDWSRVAYSDAASEMSAQSPPHITHASFANQTLVQQTAFYSISP